ncbi:MAG: cytochrome c biogenesis protein CcsA [Bacteroidetes bacterium]|nr:cytochrome c biogenesis protein CcsA [Bacteroidota bacterium]
MLKRAIKMLLSMPFAGVYVGIMAIAMAVATFIENSHGTIAAKGLVYNAKWFELVIVLMALSIFVNIFRSKLYKWSKLPVFLFHLSFLVIILGASITRYISTEGMMHIREGGISNVISSSDTYFYAQIEDQGKVYNTKQAVFLSPKSKRQVRTKLKTDNHSINFKSVDYATGRMMAARMGADPNQSNQPDVVTLKVKADGVSQEIMLRGMQGRDMQLFDFDVNGVKITAGFGSMHTELPFSIQLMDFQLERYPGSNSPSSYASEVLLVDSEDGVRKPFRIFMNNILKYKGYRFYQSSYDPDEQGTVLSVTDDYFGTLVTYIGYAMMMLTLLAAFFAPGSRFVEYIKGSKKVQVIGIALILLSLGLSSNAQNTKVSDLIKAESVEFGKIWVQSSGGRYQPANTLSQEVTRKILKKNRYGSLTANEFLISLMLDRDKWEQIPLFEVKNSDIRNLIGAGTSEVPFIQFFNQQNQYVLSQYVDQAVNHRPNQRSALDKAILKLDEQLNVFYMATSGQMLRIYPDLRDKQGKWMDLTSSGLGLPEEDSLFVRSAFPQYLLALKSNQADEAKRWREAITTYQMTYGAEDLPSVKQNKFEIFYNRILIFERLAPIYATIGLILLIIQFVAMFKRRKWQSVSSNVLTTLLAICFVLHTLGLIIRWYVSGHAPMSNGYESMIFVAWGTLLAGMILQRRSKIAVSLTAILAAMSLLVAHLSWMTPEITNLVPVLKSPWLTIHVAVIMTSYSFLGLGALIGLIVMVLYVVKTKLNQKLIDANIVQLTRINQIVIISGLYLITIGCFLGAIWANVSWGRYWGWDPKETWCLITIMVYTFLTHMHHIKGLKGHFNYNLVSLLSFSSVLMTYFGVNYFLGGMHSYAGGTTPSLPTAGYIALILIVVLIYWAYFNQGKFEKNNKNKNKK